MSYTEVFPMEILQGVSESNSYILIISSPENGKEIPILIGDYEAQAIIMAQEGISARRPMTHELFGKMMEEFGLTLKKITIDKFEEGIFYATLHLSDGFNEKKIDSRTTDAVVLALLNRCPILMETSVINEAGVEPNALLNNSPSQKSHIQQEETLEELEVLLKQYEEEEAYEKAAEIQRRIDQLTNRQTD